MSTEQEQWAAQLREVPATFRMALLSDDHAIRHRPAVGEWSAVEVVGHMIDKMHIWSGGASHGRGAACIAGIRSRRVGT